MKNTIILLFYGWPIDHYISQIIMSLSSLHRSGVKVDQACYHTVLKSKPCTRLVITPKKGRKKLQKKCVDV